MYEFDTHIKVEHLPRFTLLPYIKEVLPNFTGQRVKLRTSGRRVAQELFSHIF